MLAVDRRTGAEVWRAKLRGDFVNVGFLDRDLYAAASGELFCLDPATGSVFWHNELKGLGRGLVSRAAPGGQQTLPARQKREDDEAAASST